MMKTLMKILECVLAFVTFFRRRSSKTENGDEKG